MAPISDKSFIFNHSHSTGVLQPLGLSPRASLQENPPRAALTEVQDAAPAPPSFLHMSVSGQRFREAPARREGRNSQDLGPALSKPFQYQPWTSSNQWQLKAGWWPRHQSQPSKGIGGPQPLSCPPNHVLVPGRAVPSQTLRCLQPCHPQRATSKQQQRTPNPNTASSPLLPPGAPSEQAETLHLHVHPQAGDIPKSHPTTQPRGHV